MPPMKDSLTGRHRACFYFFDEFGIGQPTQEDISVESAPRFSTEQDALAAEAFAQEVFMETLKFCGQDPKEGR